MNKYIKYGNFFVAAGVAITGYVWLDRPKDMSIRAEDVIDIYEDAMEKRVVPYQMNDELPDYATLNAYYGGLTGVVSTIRYQDINNIAEWIREVVLKSSSAIFWTSASITNHGTLAVSLGSYASTNKLGTLWDTAATPRYVTNNVYTYSTNSFHDTIITTASRKSVAGSDFEYFRSERDTSPPMNPTNLPLGNLLFDKGPSTGITTNMVRGSWWPFPRAYTFPWEMWLTPSRTRITAEVIDSSIHFAYTNICWVTATNLTLSFRPRITTNSPGYSISRFVGSQGQTSLSFGYIQPPLTGTNGMYMGSYVIQGPLNSHFNFTVSKGGAAYGSLLKAEVVAGTSIYILKSDDYSYTHFNVTPVASTCWSIVKFTSYNDVYPQLYQSPRTNVAQIYAYVYIGPTWTGTNAYFTVTAPAFISTPITSLATTNAFPSSLVPKNDKSIARSKLDQFAQVLTNMNRTVWVTDTGSLTLTNGIYYTHSNLPENEWPYFEPWDEFLYGTGDFTPTYNTGYSLDSIRTTYLASYDRISTNPITGFIPCTLGTLSQFNFVFYAEGMAEVYFNGDWTSRTRVFPITSYKREIKYLGIPLSYPSLYAVTNGYVKKVSVFAVLEFADITPNNAYPATQPSYYSHSVSGNHIYSGNLGASNATLKISGSKDTIDTTIRKFNYADFKGTHYQELSFVNEAVLNLVYEVDNPTTPITFDFIPSDFIHSKCDTYRYHFQQSAASNAARSEDWSYNYSQYYEIRIVKWVVVVDWNFQHLGRGFTP